MKLIHNPMLLQISVKYVHKARGGQFILPSIFLANNQPLYGNLESLTFIFSLTCSFKDGPSVITTRLKMIM